MQCLCVPIVISTRETKQQTQNANSPSHLLPFEVSIKIQDTFWTGMTDHPWGHLVVSIIFNLSTVNRLPPPFNLSLSLAWQWGLLHGKFRAWSKFLWLNYQPLERGAYNGGADPALTPTVRGCNAVKDEAAQQSAAFNSSFSRRRRPCLLLRLCFQDLRPLFWNVFYNKISVVMQPRAWVSILEKVREGDRETEKIRSPRNTDDRVCFPLCSSHLAFFFLFLFLFLNGTYLLFCHDPKMLPLRVLRFYFVIVLS